MFIKYLFLIALTANEIFSVHITSIIYKEHFDQCGIMSTSAGLIQGGTNSTQVQFPWIAMISLINEDSRDQYASGSLISKRHVLAKSRYVANLDDNNIYVPVPSENVRIYLGTTKFGDLSQPGSVEVGVLKIKLYPNSRRIVVGISLFNFAILTLENDVTYSDFIKPVCLWNDQLNHRMHKGQKMMAVGYGRDLSGAISKTRKHAVVKVTSADECRDEYTDNLFSQVKESRFFCVKEVIKNHGPCRFDTQLYVKIDSAWYLRGEMISSRINEDTLFCKVSYPISVEDIAPFIEWIDQEIKSELIEFFANSKYDGIVEEIDVESARNYRSN